MPGPLSLSRPKHRGHVAFFACGTRDKLNARPVGATRYVVEGGSLFGTGLIFLDVRRSWSLWAWGAALLEVDFWDMPEKLLQLLVLQRSCGRHFRNVPKCRFLSVGLAGKFRCGEPVAGMGRRDSASAFSAAAPRCVASLLACCAGKRFAFPQLRTLAGSNPMKWAQTKTGPFRGPFPIQWWAMRDSNPQPCACKAPALTVAPIARAERV